MVSSSDTVVETSTHYPKVEGLNPASAAGRTRTEKFAKKKTQKIYFSPYLPNILDKSVNKEIN
jgi:hypothetical protein